MSHIEPGSPVYAVSMVAPDKQTRRPDLGPAGAVGAEYRADEHTAPHMTARQVLDLHADLHRTLTSPGAFVKESFIRYAVEDAFAGDGDADAGRPATWARSHLHPAEAISPAELDKWFTSLGADLFGATTYQVTGEMIDLAEALSINTPNLDDLVPEDLPSDYGFMWFDRPIERPSVEDQPGWQPILMHAISWQVVPSVKMRIQATVKGSDDEPAWVTLNEPGLRIREWGWKDDRNVVPRPLHLIGQSTNPLAPNIVTPLTQLHLVHMIWILMGMEITTTTPHRPDRPGFKRARNLAQQQVHVVTLRRQPHDPGAVRKVDWTCTWLVRGHWRHAPHGGTFADGRARTWVKAYIKGPEGLPLRAHDILYKLAR